MSFSMRFQGLICHVHVDDNPSLTRAVLVKAAHHDPRLELDWTKHLQSSQGDLPPHKNSGSIRSYDIAGWDITVFSKGMTNVRTTRDASFAKSVPSLPSVLVDSDSSKKKPKDGVHHKVHIPNATTSFIDYRDGVIKTTACIATAVLWSPSQSGDPDCIARETRYDAGWADPVLLNFSQSATGKTGTITLVPDADIAILNDAPGNHFHEYRNISDAQDIRVPVEDATKICKGCSSEPRIGTFGGGTVECTQTGYP